MREIEAALRGAITTPYMGYNKEKVENRVQNIQRTLGALHALCPPLGKGPSGMDERPSHFVSTDCHNPATISVYGGSTSFFLALVDTAWNVDYFPTLLFTVTLQPAGG